MPNLVIDGQHAIAVAGTPAELDARITARRKKVEEDGESRFEVFMRIAPQAFHRLEVRVDAFRVTHIQATDEDAVEEERG